MWVINRVFAPDDLYHQPRAGFHCILMDEGWEEWVDAGYSGSSALRDWKSDPEVTELSTDFYEAGEYHCTFEELCRLRSRTDRVTRN